MLDACAHISQAHAEPGDLIVFGSGTGTHVVIIVGTGSDPDVVSHGQERGPLLIPLSKERAFHAGEALTFLSAMGRVHAIPTTMMMKVGTNPPTEEGLEVETVMG
jgi:cell wall-associated NlpC family hydrolase